MCEVKHKHCEMIIAWANGRPIEFRTNNGVWRDATAPSWNIHNEYRIKPEPKPDVARYTRLDKDEGALYSWNSHKANYHNIKAIFDGETGKLKSVEMI